MIDKGEVFVVMPMSPVEAVPKRAAIAGALKRGGWSARFPSYDPQAPICDLPETLEQMKEAALVLADLSQERPSCYYELGLAEALGRPVYLIAQEGTPLHQSTLRLQVKFFRDVKHLCEILEHDFSDCRAGQRAL